MNRTRLPIRTLVLILGFASTCLIGCGASPTAESKKNPAADQATADLKNAGSAIPGHMAAAYGIIAASRNAQGETRNKLLASAKAELDATLKLDPNHAEALANRGVLSLEMGRPNIAIKDLELSAKIDPKSANTHYNLACAYSLAGKPDLGFDALQLALDSGFSDFDLLRSDPQLRAIRSLPGFKEMLSRRKIGQ